VKIKTTLNQDAPVAIAKGNAIAKGAELDELRALYSGRNFEGIEKRESQLTVFLLENFLNNVFGYYIEVRNLHKDKVPAEWIRKQTLVNAERYIRGT
jgi:DNA mismatch repair protein MutS